MIFISFWAKIDVDYYQHISKHIFLNFLSFIRKITQLNYFKILRILKELLLSTAS